MSKINKILSQNGFSLIELMVAVVILVMVVFGIFQAFTTAFQTLNDAKDRTIATNYAQQVLEDYKNTNFQKINPFSDSIVGTKFTQNVSVQPVNENLKNVIVQVNWTGRNNNPKNVNVSTLIYNTQTTAESGSTPMGIIIYAEPYNLLPWSPENTNPPNSEIFAEIVDEKGDRITDWNESNVNFSIESVVNLENVTQDLSYLGSLSPTSDALVEGIADTTFYQYSGEEREGYVEIKATLDVGGVEIYDTLTLKVTNDAVAVVLTTNKEIISTEGGEAGTAHLTATIVNAVGATVVTDRAIDITIISGPGGLANFTPTVDGVASIDLIAGTTAGVSTIMAASNLLEPGSINIEIVDPGVNYISVEADDQTIVQQGSTNITAYLTNYLGEPISGEIIHFSSNIGDLDSPSATTAGDGSATVTLTMDYAGTATVTATWTNPEDSTDISDTIIVLCRNHNLNVWSEPTTITVGNSATIFAELTDYLGNPLAFETINFTITAGNGVLSNIVSTDENGKASASLTINSPGTTNVEASWSGDPAVVIGDAEVICISAPTYVVELSTGSTTISVGDTPTITATVTEDGSPVGSGIEVIFSLDDYTNAKLDGYSHDVTVLTETGGIASVELSGLIAGETVTITATVDTASDSIAISCEAPSISIVLADPANIEYTRFWQWGQWNYNYNEVCFDIIITGGSVDLDKMRISWESNNEEKLNRLYINDSEVYRNNNPGAGNGTTISFNRGSSYYTLVDGNTYTIKMVFDSDVINKDWSITFIDPDTYVDISTVIFSLN